MCWQHVAACDRKMGWKHVGSVWLQDAWNSWLNYSPGNKSAAQIRAHFLTSPQPNRFPRLQQAVQLHACAVLVQQQRLHGRQVCGLWSHGERAKQHQGDSVH